MAEGRGKRGTYVPGRIGIGHKNEAYKKEKTNSFKINRRRDNDTFFALNSGS